MQTAKEGDGMEVKSFKDLDKNKVSLGDTVSLLGRGNEVFDKGTVERIVKNGSAITVFIKERPYYRFLPDKLRKR